MKIQYSKMKDKSRIQIPNEKNPKLKNKQPSRITIQESAIKNQKIYNKKRIENQDTKSGNQKS